MSRFQVNFIEKRRKTMHFRAEIQGADGRAVREKEVVHGSRFGMESKEERYPGYHANQEILPIRARKAFRYELMPKGEHIRKMKQFCGCARFVFNRALAYQKAQYESDNTVKFSYTRLANLLPEWKRELSTGDQTGRAKQRDIPAEIGRNTPG